MPDDTQQPQTPTPAGEINGYVEHSLEIKLRVIQRPNQQAAAALHESLEALTDSVVEAVLGQVAKVFPTATAHGLSLEDVAVQAVAGAYADPIEREQAEEVIHQHQKVTARARGQAPKRQVH
jgi:hypothetical protein